MFRSIALLLAPSAAAFAHHSFASEYDGTKPVTLKGTVTKIDWKNPHVYIFMDVADASGNAVNATGCTWRTARKPRRQIISPRT